MKVKRGKISDACERLEVERLVEMAVDVLEHAVQARRVFGTKVGRR